MKKLKVLATICIVIFGSVSMAQQSNGILTSGGDWAGNGADILVCPSGEPFAIELLDIYEAKRFEDYFTYDLGGPFLTFNEKISFNLRKFLAKAPSLHSILKKDLDDFFEKVIWVGDDEELTKVGDSLHVLIPKGCTVEQIVLQLPEDNEYGYRYLIVKTFWNQLTDDQKVALVFHEVLYKYAITRGHRDSRKVRKLNAMVLNTSFQNYSEPEFRAHLIEIGLFPEEGSSDSVKPPKKKRPPNDVSLSFKKRHFHLGFSQDVRNDKTRSIVAKYKYDGQDRVASFAFHAGGSVSRRITIVADSDSSIEFNASGKVASVNPSPLFVPKLCPNSVELKCVIDNDFGSFAEVIFGYGN